MELFSFITPAALALYCAVIFGANVIQALTGFAGTLLTLPPCILLFGPDLAKALANVLGLLLCGAVAWQNRAWLDRRRLAHILGLMLLGMAAGVWLYARLDASVLIPLYGALLIAVALKNLLVHSEKRLPAPLLTAILPAAGVIHGLFVSGGALLVVYLAAVFRDKHAFRANAAAVWTALNPLLMISDWSRGVYTAEFAVLLLAALPFLAAAVWLGNRIHERISQSLFRRITYGLLLLSGAMLFA